MTESDRPRVLLVSPLPPPYGGIARWTESMMSYSADDLGVDLVLVNTAHSEQRTDETAIQQRLHSGVSQAVRVWRRLRTAVDCDSKPVCAHVNTSGSLGLVRDIAVLLWCRARSIRTVMHIRFGRVPEVVATRSFEHILLHVALRMADAVISIDARTHAELASQLGERAHLIPNFIDASVYHGPAASGRDRDRNVLFLGWVGESKGIAELIAAWESLDTTGWTLTIAGPLSPAYANPPTITRGHLVGTVTHEEAMGLMSRASLFVLPSHTEGFPNVVLEAMANGTPVVATDVGAIPDILADGAGIVIPAKSASALAQALRSMLDDPELREAMAARALNRVRTEYSLETVVQAYRSIWIEKSARRTTRP